MKTIGLILGTVLGTAVVVFLSSIWSGYVLTKLWGWFVSSTFNLPFLQIAPAIGIMLIINYLTNVDTSDLAKKNDDDSPEQAIFKALLKAFLKPLFALLFGWIILQFM